MKRMELGSRILAAALMAAAAQGVCAAPGDTAAMDPVKACSEFPKGHPYSCEKLAAMDTIKACNELPPDHPYGCQRLLSLVPKCPPGQTTCKHNHAKNEGEKGFLTDGEGRKVTAASLGSVRSASLSGVFAPASN